MELQRPICIRQNLFLTYSSNCRRARKLEQKDKRFWWEFAKVDVKRVNGSQIWEWNTATSAETKLNLSSATIIVFQGFNVNISKL